MASEASRRPVIGVNEPDLDTGTLLSPFVPV
jgi:hypothetical protein